MSSFFNKSRYDLVIMPVITGNFSKIHFYDKDKGLLRLILIAKNSQVFKEGQYFLMNDIRLLYFNDSDMGVGKKFIEVTANKAKFNYVTLEAEAWGNVKVIGFNEFFIKSEYIHWNSNLEIFKTKNEELVNIYRLIKDSKSNKKYIIRLLGKNVSYDSRSQILEIEDSTTIFKKEIFEKKKE